MVPDHRVDALAELYEQGDALASKAQSAAQISGDGGSDTTASVRVRLDQHGRVTAVSVVPGWQRRLSVEALPEAVLEAVRDAATRRLTAWGEAFSEDAADQGTPAAGGPAHHGPAGGGAGSSRVPFTQDEMQRRLHEVTTRQMSPEDRRAALAGLLELAEAIERGIDEVSAKMETTLSATHTGHSRDRHVTVTMTGGGEVSAVRLDRTWLREAHEVNIGRQITAAFQAAYEKVAARGVNRLVADSPLGEVQQLTQDPLGLAHRLRLID